MASRSRFQMLVEYKRRKLKAQKGKSKLIPSKKKLFKLNCYLIHNITR